MKTPSKATPLVKKGVCPLKNLATGTISDDRAIKHADALVFIYLFNI